MIIMARLDTFRDSGFFYRSEYFCHTDDCLIEALIAEGRLSPAARDEDGIEMLGMLAETEALSDAEMRDSDTFPRRVLVASGEGIGEYCATCGTELDRDHS